jgi:hypothetical protein
MRKGRGPSTPPPPSTCGVLSTNHAAPRSPLTPLALVVMRPLAPIAPKLPSWGSQIHLGRWGWGWGADTPIPSLSSSTTPLVLPHSLASSPLSCHPPPLPPSYLALGLHRHRLACWGIASPLSSPILVGDRAIWRPWCVGRVVCSLYGSERDESARFAYSCHNGSHRMRPNERRGIDPTWDTPVLAPLHPSQLFP